jgi:hypothetical protein
MKEKVNNSHENTGPTILNNRVDTEQVQKVSEETGIPARIFINALALNKDAFPKFLGTDQNILSNDSKDVKTARAKWHSYWAVYDAKVNYHSTAENSEDEKRALDNWNNLALEQAVEASTIEETQRVYEQSPDGSLAQRLAVLKIFYLASNE